MPILGKDMRDLLTRDTRFRNVWLGETAANFGMQLTTFLLPLVAVTALDSSGTGVGMISVGQFLPVVAFSLIAGLVVDRHPPRRTLVAGTVARGAAVAAIAALYATGSLTLVPLVLLTAVVGTANVFYEVAYQSTIPKIVPTDAITAANGLHQSTYSVSQLAGSSAAGFLLGRFGLSATLAVTTALFVGAAISGFMVRGVQAPGVAVAGRSPLRSIGDGLRYTWALRPIRDLCVQAGVANLHMQAFLTAFLLFAVRDAGLSGTMVGVVVGIGSVGSLIGSLCASRLADRFAVGTLLCAGVVLAAVGLLGEASASRAGSGFAVSAAVAFAVQGFGVALFNVFAVSLRQAIPVEHQLGAVTAGYRLVALGTLPLGGLVGGLLADAVTAAGAVWLISGSYLLFSCLLMFSPLRTVRTVEEAKNLGEPAAHALDVR
ncbi:hypothetical protein GCM10010320_67200 [Streptomyces caelestis]|nr:hypothetical protein GCM10010320_67200 [Streptomyces caelestis]